METIGIKIYKLYRAIGNGDVSDKGEIILYRKIGDHIGGALLVSNEEISVLFKDSNTVYVFARDLGKSIESLFYGDKDDWIESQSVSLFSGSKETSTFIRQ